MNDKIKKGVALILIPLVLSVQLAACEQKTETQSEDKVYRLNGKLSLNMLSKDKSSSESITAEEWLLENIDSIRKSLLYGKYETVVVQLLELRTALVNDPQYNSLLYIAYMGSGSSTEAKAILDNENLDTDAFKDAVVENCDVLRENERIAEIEKELLKLLMKNSPPAPAYINSNRDNQDADNSEPLPEVDQGSESVGDETLPEVDRGNEAVGEETPPTDDRGTDGDDINIDSPTEGGEEEPDTTPTEGPETGGGDECVPTPSEDSGETPAVPSEELDNGE